MITKKDIEKVANLSKMPLDVKELSAFSAQLPKMLLFVEKLNKLGTESVLPTYQVTDKKNELRKDVPSKSLAVDLALRNARLRKGNYILTEGVLDAK